MDAGGISCLLPAAQGLMSTTTAVPSRICQLVQNLKDIDRLIASDPSCSCPVSHEVDRLLVEVEATRDYYLKR
jgi:hypothetical protein